MMAKQLRAEIRTFAETMEDRMREKQAAVLAGDVPHLKRMTDGELLDGAKKNLDHFLGEPMLRCQAMKAAADVANYLNALTARYPEAGAE
jgi:hypothetical protein